MNILQSRYTPELLLQSYDKLLWKDNVGELIFQNEQATDLPSIEIFCSDKPDERLLKSFLMVLHMIDLFVQSGTNDFDLYRIDVHADTIRLYYCGNKVNTEFNVYLSKQENSWYCSKIGVGVYAPPICLVKDNQIAFDTVHPPKGKKPQVKTKVRSKWNRTLLIISACLTLFSAVMTTVNLIALPNSRLLPVVLAGITLVIYASNDFRRKTKFALLFMLPVLLIYAMSTFIDPRERRTEYRSPMGSNTIVVEYDHASRPFIYRKENFLFMTPIYEMSVGYNATIHHEITWLSENTILMTDYLGGEWNVVVNGQVKQP